MFLSAPALCQTMPPDVPEGHYAYDAINSLVERGINVSQGYPDGTFRGNDRTNRYQTAYLMAKLAISLRETIPTTEIDTSDIEEEISYLRSEIRDVKNMPEMKSDFKYYGSVDLMSRFGGVFAYEQDNRVELGPETLYRFKYTVEKQMGSDAFLKMNIDTMDGGFNSATARGFPARLLDVEGDITADIGLKNPIKITALVGPGSVLHRDTSGVDPSDDGTYFSRPRPTIKVSTPIGGYDVSASYVARSVSAYGSVGTSELNVQLIRNIGEIPFMGTTEMNSTTRYAFVELLTPSFAPNDLREELSFTGRLSDSFSQKILFGLSGTDTFNNNYYLNYELHLSSGSDSADLLFNSVGSNYRLPFEDLEFVPLNLFDRKILDDTVDIGLRLARGFSGGHVLASRTEYVMSSGWKMGRDFPGSSFTQEISFDYRLQRDINLRLYYRYYYVPSRIAQFGTVVPEVSDLFGIGLNYRF